MVLAITLPDEVIFFELVKLGLQVLVPILACVGVVVCFRYRRLSPRLLIMLIGFILEAVNGTFTLMVWPILEKEYYGYIVDRNLPRLGHVISFAVIIVGLASVLADLRRKLSGLSRLPHAAGHQEPCVPAEIDLARWPAKRTGSAEIQE